MAIASGSGKNLWIAASDGDLERVKELIGVQGMSPNSPDHNTYTPLHAAASYSHLELLEYLLSVGGNINITDSDGDTPLFGVEDVEVAKWMVEKGADWKVVNGEGLIAAESLFEDHPEVSLYLTSLSAPTSSSPTSSFVPQPTLQTSAYQTNATANLLTDSLLSQTEAIMQQREELGEEEVDRRLREVVGGVVGEGMRFGREEGEAEMKAEEEFGDVGPAEKRKRTD